MDSSSITVLMPAFQESERIGGSVSAALGITGVTRVLVIDDGSQDATADIAAHTGAQVLRLSENQGKAAALRAGLVALPGADDDIILLLDADLGESAADGEKLLRPLLADEADMSIGIFPRAPGKGGFGLVKSLARWGCFLLTGQRLQAPISGQRACRRKLLQAAPLGEGYGLEVTMNVAAIDAGARVCEVPVQMTHNFTGRNLRGFQHRGRQFKQIFIALLAAAFGHTGEPITVNIFSKRSLGFLFTILFAGWLLAGLPGIPREVMLPYGSIVGLDNRLIYLIPVLLLFGLLLVVIFSGLLRARRLNYRQRYIPSLGGLIFLPVLSYLFITATADMRGQLLMLLAWMLLGMYDDLFGNAQSKGFRGHLKALQKGQLSSGGVKMLVGGVLALLMATMQYGNSVDAIPLILLAALIIALSANAINLFDLRPGRAVKLFSVLTIPLYLLATCWLNSALLPLIALMLLITFCYAPFDFSATMMLGDTGANLLGAFLGLMLVIILPPSGQIVVLLLLLGLHFFAERYSITTTINRVGWLRAIDHLGVGE